MLYATPLKQNYIVNSVIMNRKVSILFILLMILTVACVENLIFIQLHPDGQSYLKFYSRGDSTDIMNGDFQHPFPGQNWASKTSQQIRDDDSSWVQTTEGLIRDSVFVHTPTNSSGLTFELKRWKTSSRFSSYHHFKMIFHGRKIKSNFPLLHQAILTEKKDSLHWLPEALTIIIDKSLKNLTPETLTINDQLWNQRLVNHFRNTFARIQSLDDLEGMQNDRVKYIRNNLKPFSVSDSLAEKLADKMSIHEEYLQTSLDLDDDTFEIKVLMPGQVVSTNSSSFNRDTLVWSFGLDSLLNDKFTLQAVSVIYAIENIEKMIILGVCILLIFFGFLLIRWFE